MYYIKLNTVETYGILKNSYRKSNSSAKLRVSEGKKCTGGAGIASTPYLVAEGGRSGQP